MLFIDFGGDFIKRSLLVTFSLISVCILCVTLLSSILLYEVVYRREYEQRIMDASSRTLYSMDSALTSLYSEVKTFSTSVVANQSLQDLINANNEEYDVQNELALEIVLYNLTLATEKISTINLFDLASNQYSYSVITTDTPLYTGHYTEQEWYAVAAQLDGGSSSFLWEDGYHEASDYTGICIARQLISMDTLEEIGFITVDVGDEVLEDIFSPFTENYDSALYLLDSNGAMFMSFNTDGQWSLEMLSREELVIGAQVLSIDDVDYVVDVCVNQSSGLTMISVSLASQIEEDLGQLRLMTILIFVAGILMAMLCILLVTRRLLNPIHALTDSMSQVVEREVFIPVSTPTNNDEIGRMKDIYNHMIQTIQTYLTRSIEEEQQKRKSELKALQAQIKPHFLYNTFDSISALALQGDNKTVYQALQHLSSFYRLSLNNGKERITLEEELKLIYQYTEILKIRFPETFEMVYEIAEDTRGLLLPKLTLQPFIENSIHHGIFTLGELGIITVRSCIQDNHWVIEIEDNGKGMSDNKIAYLLCTDKTVAKSFGARSTIERIRLLYGEKSDIQIMSEVNRGTTIRIQLSIGENLL